jgi:hypothetical protein
MISKEEDLFWDTYITKLNNTRTGLFIDTFQRD